MAESTGERAMGIVIAAALWALQVLVVAAAFGIGSDSAWLAVLKVVLVGALLVETAWLIVLLRRGAAVGLYALAFGGLALILAIAAPAFVWL